MAGKESLAVLLDRRVREGELWEPLADGKLRCYACGHRCVILPGQRGICKVRYNEGGRLLVPFGYVAGLQLDPVEKKPFFHAYPGSRALSFGMLGCDYHCGYCFSGETRVVTSRGVLQIKALFQGGGVRMPDGGEVAALPGWEAVTHEGTPAPIRQVFRHPYRGSLVVVTPYYLPPFRCTPDHRVFATSDPASPPTLVEARSLAPGHFLAVPKPLPRAGLASLDVAAVLGGVTRTLRVPRKLTPAEVEAIMAATGEGQTSREIGASLGKDPSYIRHVQSRVRRGLWVYERVRGLAVEGDSVRFFKERRPGIPRLLHVDKPLARLLGYYCAEGCVVAAKNRPNSLAVVLTFGPAEVSRAEKVRALFAEVFGLRPHVVHRKASIAVGIGKSSLALLLATLCGERAESKRVPSVLLEADPSVVEAFLDAFVAGDGHLYDNGKVGLTTISEDLAYGVAWLALRVGYLPSVYPARLPGEKLIEGRTVRQAATQYTVVWYREPLRRRVRETDTHFLVPIRALAEQPYEGWVYNLEVEGTHSYLANFVAVGNCQNWLTSQALRDSVAGTPPQDVTPEEIIALARRYKARILTSTYNEPLITSEWAVEVFRAAKPQGLVCSYVSNGNATPEVLEYIRPWVDLYKVDLKGFDDKHYRKLGGVLQVVLDSIRRIWAMGFWLEIVTLVVPGFNDSDEELREIARFLVSVSPDIPWHVTAFHQDYKMTDRPSTQAQALIRAAEIGVAEGLRYVYAGNIPGGVGPFENTYCPTCRTLLIERVGYTILQYTLLPGGACPKCQTRIPGRWD